MCLPVAACMEVDDLRSAVPQDLADSATVAGYESIRFWGDDAAGVTAAELEAIRAQRKAAGLPQREMVALTISGGGSNGAFGAGILNGWTSAGNRPQFDVVTGISTGSLIAPFAFLGPQYDRALAAAYTSISGKDIYAKQGLGVALATGALESSGPLRATVDRFLTDAMVEGIAAEHARGRRLLIGTTNLDAERPVIWNLGAIAASGLPNRRQLMKDVIVASASIPGVFPPVRIKVEAGGETFDEMHVDGGTSNQVFLLPAGFSFRDIDAQRGQSGVRRRLYIIRNAQIAPQYSAVKPKLVSIAGKSISSLIRTQGIGDLYRMYVVAKRDGVEFFLIDMPPSFTRKEKTPFEQAYMQALFKVGYDMAAGGLEWQRTPPGYQ